MENPFSVRSKVIVVTGATGALAGSAAAHLARQGARVALVSRTASKLEELATALAGSEGEAAAFPCDVLERGSLQAVRNAVLDRFGRVDALVNGAGGNRPGAVIGPEASLFDLKDADFDEVVDLNLKGTLLPTLVFGEAMVQAGGGAVVNFSSMAAQRGLTRVLGYSAAKGGVDSLTRWLATEFAQRHGERFRVNAVAPGFFVGDQNRRLLLNDDGSPTERGRQIIGQTPMGRFGEAGEVASLVQFLVSEASRFITGQVVAVDGGFSAYSGV